MKSITNNIIKVLEDNLQGSLVFSELLTNILTNFIDKQKPSESYLIYIQIKTNSFKLKINRKVKQEDEIGDIKVDHEGLIIDGLPDAEIDDLKIPCDIIKSEIRKEIEFYLEHEIYLPDTNLHKHLKMIYFEPLKQIVNTIMAKEDQNLNRLLYSVSTLDDLIDCIKLNFIDLCKPTVHELFDSSMGRDKSKLSNKC